MYRNLGTLLSITEATDEDQTGTTYAVLPSEYDQVADHQMSWRIFFDITQSGGATSPTTDVTVETSHDSVGWVTVCTATQLTENGSSHEFKELTALGPFVRARTALGGGSKPNHMATVELASNAPFRLHPMQSAV